MALRFNIPRDVYDKIMYWVNKSSDEVSGFGTLTVNGEDITVVDAFLLPQKVGGAHTDIDPEALSKLQYQCYRDKIEGELKWWWHSHVKMDVFWSGTDKETIKQLGEQGWIVATVFNQKNEQRSAFCAQVDVPMLGKKAYFVDELSVFYTNYYPAGATETWDKDFEECVTKNKYTPKYESSLLNGFDYWEREKYTKGKRKLRDYTRATDQEKVKQEAKLLGMSIAEYTAICDGSASWQEQYAAQEKIDQLERQGRLPHGLFY